MVCRIPGFDNRDAPASTLEEPAVRTVAEVNGMNVFAKQARKKRCPALIEIRSDPNVSDPSATIDDLRNKAKA